MVDSDKPKKPADEAICFKYGQLVSFLDFTAKGLFQVGTVTTVLAGALISLSVQGTIVVLPSIDVKAGLIFAAIGPLVVGFLNVYYNTRKLNEIWSDIRSYEEEYDVGNLTRHRRIKDDKNRQWLTWGLLGVYLLFMGIIIYAGIYHIVNLWPNEIAALSKLE